jgi:hypothetical protein
MAPVTNVAVCPLLFTGHPNRCRKSAFGGKADIPLASQTRIVGFFVSAIGVGLIFDGVIEALESHGVTTLH